jgi:hypothetical protein
MGDKKSAGRPKAKHPRDARVTVRLTDEEAEILNRITQGKKTLSACVREALTHYIQTRYFSMQSRDLPDNEQTHLNRNLRQARRANAAPQPDLEQHIAEAVLGPEEELTSEASGQRKGLAVEGEGAYRVEPR